MFNSKEKNKGSGTMNVIKNNRDDLPTVNMISEGTEVIGTLKTPNDIRIAGKVDGQAEVEGKIIIASTGHVEGNINSADADIAGRVDGEVHVSSKLTLRQSAVVEGDLYAQNLVVEEGATFNGGCHMRDYASKPKAEPGKAEKAEKVGTKTKAGRKEPAEAAVVA
jgi:cytoskeletal protein CcmA (bactofilin family)